MIARYCIPFIAVLLIAADPPAKSDLAKLQGEWELVSTNGAPSDSFGTSVVIKGNEWEPRFEGGFVGQVVKFRLNSSKTPRQIECKDTDGKRIPWAIYKVEADTFTLCQQYEVLEGGFVRWGELPKEFKAGDKMHLSVYKRARSK